MVDASSHGRVRLWRRDKEEDDTWVPRVSTRIELGGMCELAWRVRLWRSDKEEVDTWISHVILYWDRFERHVIDSVAEKNRQRGLFWVV